MTRRVKITKLPEAGYGRPISEGWSTKNKNGYTASLLSDKTSSPVRKTLTSVPREEANVEAEGGETVVGDFQKDGLDEFYNIQGPRHADGPGVPLNLPESFIFSDTKKMRINNPDLLKIFGKSKGSYTPAALSKRYQLNDYNAKLLDKDTDTLEKETAELMINNNRDKLSKLAIIQEVYLKGGNVPKFAFPYLEKKGINTSQLATDQDDINEEQYRYGGYLPKAVLGTEMPINPYAQQQTTPTGASNAYKRDLDQDIEGLRKIGIYDNSQDRDNRYYQNQLYQYALKNNPQALLDMWKEYGATKAAGTGDTYKNLTLEQLPNLQSGFADNIWAARSGKLLEKLLPTETTRAGGAGSGSAMATNVPAANNPVVEPQPPASNTPTTCPEGKVLKDGVCVDPVSVKQGSYDYSQYPSQPFFKSDVVDLYGSAFSLFDNTDVGPTYQRVAGPRTINPVLEDPTRAIANRQEGAARATDAIKAFGRNPSSAASYMQGLAAGDTADIISGVNQRNIGTLNQAQGFNAQMLGNYDRSRQMADRQYDVDLATYLQQKANTRAQKRNVFTNKLSQAYTNQGNINLLNAQDPSFMFSTRANNIRFTGQPGSGETQATENFGVPADYMDWDEAKQEKYNRMMDAKYKALQMQNSRLGVASPRRGLRSASSIYDRAR
jgi:hypothetical protein